MHWVITEAKKGKHALFEAVPSIQASTICKSREGDAAFSFRFQDSPRIV